MSSKRKGSGRKTTTSAFDMDKAGFKLFGIRLGSAKDSETMQSLPNKVKRIQDGTIIKSKNQTFRVMGRIGESSYSVKRIGFTKGVEYFMHVEPLELPVDAPQLKRHVFFLQNLKGQREENMKHFLQLEDRGRVPGQCNYLITTMADLNLDDLRKKRLNGQFKPPTAMALSAQTLQAIHDVHLSHYIHRDIRPSNFLVGLAPSSNVVYLVGFSLAYKYFPSRKKSKDEKPQTPRKLKKWRATEYKFQSRSYHLGTGTARIDDIESWFYMCIDFFAQTLLPWSKMNNERDIFLGKQLLFCDGCEQIYDVIPKNFRAIKNAIIATSRLDPVDYTLFADVLLSCTADIPYDLYGPFEWEEGVNESERKNDVQIQKTALHHEKKTKVLMIRVNLQTFGRKTEFSPLKGDTIVFANKILNQKGITLVLCPPLCVISFINILFTRL